MVNPVRQSENHSIENGKITVMIVDDHSLMRDSVRIHLESQPDIQVVGEAGDGEEAVRLASELNPDVIIMDKDISG